MRRKRLGISRCVIPPSHIPLKTYLGEELSRVKLILRHMGFCLKEGSSPIVPWRWNFNKLNIADNHPIIKDHKALSFQQLVYRSQTTSNQFEYHIHNAPFVKTGWYGSVFRMDKGSTKNREFTQIDLVAPRYSIERWMKELEQFFHLYFGGQIELRWRHHYFPFTTPSFEVDVWDGNDWLEVAGGGIMNLKPKLGVAAVGIGLERLCMIKQGFKHIGQVYRVPNDNKS